MRYSRTLFAALVGCILALNINLATAATAITGCTTITKSGSYVLANNITATTAVLKPTWIPGYTGCIVIAANLVTLDMHGYVITGPGGFTVAIAQDTTSRTGNVVSSGSITGFSDGLAFAGTSHTIQNVNASNNGDAGIYLLDAGNRVIGNTTNGNGGYGIYITACPNVLVANVGNGNGSTNIREPSGCTDNRQQNVPNP